MNQPMRTPALEQLHDFAAGLLAGSAKCDEATTALILSQIELLPTANERLEALRQMEDCRRFVLTDEYWRARSSAVADHLLETCDFGPRKATPWTLVEQAAA